MSLKASPGDNDPKTLAASLLLFMLNFRMRLCLLSNHLCGQFVVLNYEY